MNPEARTVVESFLSRDFPALSQSGGLPDGVSLVDMAAELHADPDSYVRTFMGDPPREIFWCQTDDAGFDDPVRIWFRDGAVLKLDGRWPHMDPADLEVLGPPDDAIDTRMDVVDVPAGLRLWARLGLAAALNSDGTRVTSISLFSRTTPQRFRTELLALDEYRERPAPWD